MTFRARPVARRPGRSGWDPGARRTTLINAGFAGAIVVSILILVGYAGWTFYQNHFGTAASVDPTGTGPRPNCSSGTTTSASARAIDVSKPEP